MNDFISLIINKLLFDEHELNMRDDVSNDITMLGHEEFQDKFVNPTYKT